MLSIIDHISDMINKIKIGQSINLKYIFIDFSKIIFSILKVLRDEGYIVNFFHVSTPKNVLIIYIKYFKGKPVIQVFRRISKLSLKVYKKYKNLPIIMNGLGVSIVSTVNGVVADKIARYLGLGGEIICHVF